MDPYVWTVCADLQENGRIPSIESLKPAHPRIESSHEVIFIDWQSDSSLKELLNRAHGLSCNCIKSDDIVELLAKLVCSCMGGAASTREEELVPICKEFSDGLKDCLRSVVIPIGSLSIGLCRQRALLFKNLKVHDNRRQLFSSDVSKEFTNTFVRQRPLSTKSTSSGSFAPPPPWANGASSSSSIFPRMEDDATPRTPSCVCSN